MSTIATKASEKTTVVDTSNILDVRRRQVKAKAIQFTGKNGKEVVAFVKASEDLNESTARNGGSYVSIKSEKDQLKSTVRKGDFLVLDVHDNFVIYEAEEFLKYFSIKG